MKRVNKQHLIEWVLITGFLLAALAGALRWGWLDRADHWLYDTSITYSGRPPSPDILILAIDEKSLSQVGRWPWSRSILADVLNRLTQAGAGPVLLDIIFSEPQSDDAASDEKLAAAMARHGRVVLPVMMPKLGGAAVPPLNEFAAVSHLGHVQGLVDEDGITRRYLLVETAGERTYTHVAQRLVDLLDNSQSQQLLAHGSEASLVPFAGPTDHFQQFSIADLLDGRIDERDIKGRFVLLGATAAGLGDNLVTPLAGKGGTMPGVEFVANVLDGLHSKTALQPADASKRLLGSCCLLLILMVALLATTPQAGLWLTVLICLSVALAAIAGLKLWGWWWPPAAPIAVLALAYPLWSWRRLEASLNAMSRETERISSIVSDSQLGQLPNFSAGSFFDPVENRIAAITRAVDQITSALAVDENAPENRQQREEMMRHLAHDLRSPLVSLRALAASLSNDRRANNLAVLNRIDECAKRALELSEQFLLMGRAEALDPTRFVEVDLVQILHESADDLMEDARRSGAVIQRNCQLDNVPVLGDARLLHRALLNLGWNALRHGPTGGTVTLTLDKAVDGYTLSVHDQGNGFEPNELTSLSQCYGQCSTSSKSQGHRLGLALVQLVAKKHQFSLRAIHPLTGGFSMELGVVYIPQD